MTHDIESPRIYPTLRCKDAEAMIGWLKTVIGFTEHVIYRDEMELRDTDYGSRDFACRDPEGNLWSFGTYWPKAHKKPLP
ncbi:MULTISPECIES: hypothetical protein [unclassified Bradyrhizobium]|uniref:hypothetical protein n=1 Tax=unclassified Bradyrhizobium TaxID=2631580 RepID=UPI001BACA860|nr:MULTISPECIES: hypothetical protein [unclassified Bradyrhizobium]MBR1205399.1 hypothetical protein [Bradyrhizobium sp. AUGA SZCCT0124]MBR1312478.1 hypothetical protein [Bradyrhizobium sp. AUGA SZCCT0051]MBR1344503.1 hypothetical protein [Bradyrhizobium sp. AUGA SZCCT0105]MBR1359160.1 hypothetical protein [Bradyrhizobium sp. AUGA SZCCT0045]